MHHLACIRKYSQLEHQKDFSPNPSCFDDFAKVQHKLLTKPSKVLMLYQQL